MDLRLIQKIKGAYIVCRACGNRYGRNLNQDPALHHGKCEICCRWKQVADFKEFGFAKEIKSGRL